MSLRDILNGTLPPAPGAPVTPLAAPIETAARAAQATNAAAVQPTGNPETDLANLLASFEANQGVAPRVNPPEAAKVLATKTLQEVKGVPEPEVEETPEVEPPTSKPADVVAAEAAPKNRRTAAVVQAELDVLLDLHNKLVAEHETLKAAGRAVADEVRAEFEAETKILQADLAKASARADDLQKTNESQQGMLEKAASVITTLNQRLAAKPAAAPAASGEPVALEAYSAVALSQALSKQGFTVQLTVPAQ